MNWLQDLGLGYSYEHMLLYERSTVSFVGQGRSWRDSYLVLAGFLKQAGQAELVERMSWNLLRELARQRGSEHWGDGPLAVLYEDGTVVVRWGNFPPTSLERIRWILSLEGFLNFSREDEWRRGQK